MKEKVGILYPGQMGISVAASAKNSGQEVYWESEGRGPQTRVRAEKYGLIEMGTLGELCRTCAVIVSVCPPHAAEEVAERVRAQGFKGLYLDANAISPKRAERIGEVMSEAGVEFVDGGIIGEPAWEPGKTWLYLSGRQAERAAACFSAGPIEPRVIGERIGKASALKMCYAAFTKGTTALLSAILATAEGMDVREELEAEWSRKDAGFVGQTHKRVRSNTAKAWRFAGEMEEIAATFRQAGLPGEFHLAAAEIFRRLARFKDAKSIPPLEDVLAALKDPGVRS